MTKNYVNFIVLSNNLIERKNNLIVFIKVILGDAQNQNIFIKLMKFTKTL